MPKVPDLMIFVLTERQTTDGQNQLKLCLCYIRANMVHTYFANTSQLVQVS